MTDQNLHKTDVENSTKRLALGSSAVCLMPRMFMKGKRLFNLKKQNSVCLYLVGNIMEPPAKKPTPCPEESSVAGH